MFKGISEYAKECLALAPVSMISLYVNREFVYGFMHNKYYKNIHCVTKGSLSEKQM
jgi:hypothetical protein